MLIGVYKPLEICNHVLYLYQEPNRPVPSSYTVILESLDGLEDVVLKTTNIATDGDVVVVDVDRRLPLSRVWNCMILAYGCQQNAILRDIELSESNHKSTVTVHTSTHCKNRKS